MSTPPSLDPYVGMSAEDKARAIAYQSEQQAIAAKRLAAAKALQAPPGPAQAVRDAWAGVSAALAARKPGGGRAD